MTKFFIFYFLFFIFCTSCEKNYDNNFNNDKMIVIKRNYVDNSIKFKDLIKNISILELKNISNEDIIYSIDKIKFFDENYFVLDKKKNNLLVFNIKGEFINKIGKRGNGPGEVNSIADFEIDLIHHEIVLIDNKLNTFFRFKKNGEFINSKRIPEIFPTHLALNNNEIILSCDYASDNFKDLIFFDKKFEKIKEEFQLPKKLIPYGFEYTGGVNNKGIEVLYQESLSSFIYGIDNKSNIYLKYKIDLGETMWPEKKRFQHEDFVESNNKSIGTNNLSYLTNKFIENDRFFVFEYINQKVFYGFYSKITKKTYTNEKTFKNDYLISLFFCSAHGLKDNNFFMKGITTEDYNGKVEYDENFANNISKFSMKTFNVLEKNKNKNNAFILTYEFKD